MYYGVNNQDGSRTPIFYTVEDVVADIQEVLEGVLSEWECYETHNEGSEVGVEVRFPCPHRAHYAQEDWSCDNDAAWPDTYCWKHEG